MKNANRQLVSYLMVFTLALGSLSIPAAASAGEPHDFGANPRGGYVLLDSFLLRPLMLVGTVVGTATFLVTLPFSAMGGNVSEAAETLVIEPAQYTFVRPLGDI